MKAAVYREPGRPARRGASRSRGLGTGEILVRVDACGVCGTDIKKIQKGLLPAPRVFGHEIAGTVARARHGRRRRFREGDRVVAAPSHPLRGLLLLPRAAPTRSARVQAATARRRASSPRAGASPSS